MGLVAERTDDSETIFKRVLDDPEFGGVLMDWYAARVCRPARGKSSNRGLWPSSYTGQSRSALDSGATNTQRECDSLAPWGRHDCVLTNLDLSVVVVRGGATTTDGRRQPQKCGDRNVCYERNYRHEQYRESSL
jgi:hypothetical protein